MNRPLHLQKKIFTLFLSFAVPIHQAPLAFAADDDVFQFFAEEAKVFTASRREQSIQDSPVAIDVITGDDIAASKALNLWDLLRFRVGVDVTDTRTINNNRAVVSVRGFGEEFNNSLQVLVDGRSVYQGAFGGVLWQQIPVQLQDIDRIEIVRGPNSALYGSNSGLGVINIITKKPRATALSLGGYHGNQGLVNSEVAAETVGKNYGLRTSYTRREEDGLVTSSGGNDDDAMSVHKINIKSFWNPTDESTLEILGGSAHDKVANAGLASVLAVFGNEPELDFQDHFQQAKYSLKTGANSSFEAMGARRDSSVRNVTREYQYDAEALQRVSWADDRFNTMGGASYRSYMAFFPFFFSPQTPRQRNEIYRGFLQQSWKPLDKLTLSGAVSLEKTSLFGTEPAYQASVVNGLNDQHTLRATYANSPTLPPIFNDRLNLTAPFPPFGFYTLTGNRDLVPSQITSYEISHLGVFANRRLDTELTAFYMTFHDIIGIVPTGPLSFSFANNNHAIARGAEFKTRYRFRQSNQLYANYTFEHITDDVNNVTFTDGTPAHKANIGGRWTIIGGLSGGIDVGYKTSYKTTDTEGTVYADIPSYTRLDARLIYNHKNMEFFVAGQNLTRPRHIEHTASALHIPRIYYGGATLRFATNP